jgi:membrane-associated phospholipid phosphatase
MTEEQLTKKRLLFIGVVVYFIIGYLSCSFFNLHRSYYINVSLPFESKISFVPVFILGYTAVYAAIILIYALIDDYEIFKRGMRFACFASTIHFILFLIIPVKMARPELSETDGLMTLLTHYYYLIDNPVNCFPSLHVSYPLMGTLILWNYKRRWGYILAASTALIAISVILVKQHYIMDVAGALLTTSSIFYFLRGPLKCRP